MFHLSALLLPTAVLNLSHHFSYLLKRCYVAVETRGVFTTRPLLPATKKNVLPSHHHINFISQFLCHCDSRYVGPTSQSLQECIEQHVPRLIRNHHFSQDRSNLSCACKKNSTSQIIAHDYAIGQDLLENPSHGSQYSDTKISILAQGRTQKNTNWSKRRLNNVRIFVLRTSVFGPK